MVERKLDRWHHRFVTAICRLCSFEIRERSNGFCRPELISCHPELYLLSEILIKDRRVFTLPAKPRYLMKRDFNHVLNGRVKKLLFTLIIRLINEVFLAKIINDYSEFTDKGS